MPIHVTRRGACRTRTLFSDRCMRQALSLSGRSCDHCSVEEALMTKAELELTVPTDREARLAGDLARAIDAVSRHPGAFALRVQAEGEEPETLELPDAAVASLRVILAAMAEGRPIAVHAADKDVTIDQAADVLNVSRATVLMLDRTGAIACETCR
ncbi:MAG: hypothetical protein HC774_02480 [Sphingomonadales bacterium]|nr:hypothetical protein [Sphingomonadales bacterium]